jgi:hypothetical protein
MKSIHAALAVLVCAVLLGIISAIGYSSKGPQEIELAEEFLNAWKTAIDTYYKDLKDGKKASEIVDLAKRLDEGAKNMGAEDWVDLCLKLPCCLTPHCTGRLGPQASIARKSQRNFGGPGAPQG